MINLVDIRNRRKTDSETFFAIRVGFIEDTNVSIGNRIFETSLTLLQKE